VPADAIVDGAIIDAGIRCRRHPPRLRQQQSLQDEGRLRVTVWKRGHRQEDHAPGDDRKRAGGIDLLGSRAVHPFDIQDVNLDYQILDPGTGPIRAAAWTCSSSPPRKKKSPTTPTSSRSRAHPIIVDVDAFALQNAFEVNYGLEAGRIVVLLNAGASAININILQGDQSVFTRDYFDGWQRLHGGGAEGTRPAVRISGATEERPPVDGATFEEAQPVLHAVTENVLLEIQKTFDFFKAGLHRSD
jgi:type IV pilus assembly protein PilM